MNIAYRNERTREPTSKARMALIGLSWLIRVGGALDKLTDDKDVPATKVLAELDFELGRTSFRAEIDKERPALEAFRAHVLREIEREKADALALKLARQLAKCDLSYQQAQSRACGALEKINHDWRSDGW